MTLSFESKFVGKLYSSLCSIYPSLSVYVSLPTGDLEASIEI